MSICDTLLEALIILQCNAIICKHKWRHAPRSTVDDANVWDADVFPAPRLRKISKKVTAAIATSAIASSAISLLYLHSINIYACDLPCVDGRRRTTSSVNVHCCIAMRQVDEGRRAVSERAFSFFLQTAMSIKCWRLLLLQINKYCQHLPKNFNNVISCLRHWPKRSNERTAWKYNNSPKIGTGRQKLLPQKVKPANNYNMTELDGKTSLTNINKYLRPTYFTVHVRSSPTKLFTSRHAVSTPRSIIHDKQQLFSTFCQQRQHSSQVAIREVNYSRRLAEKLTRWRLTFNNSWSCQRNAAST